MTDAEHCGARDDCSGAASGVQCSGQATCVSGRCQGWHAAELLEHRGQESAYLPRAAVDGRGNAIAVWTRVHEVDAEEVHEVVSNQFDPQSRTWLAEAVKLSDDVGNASQPAVSMDAESNVVAVWSDNDTGYSRIAGKEQHTGVWSQQLELETVADNFSFGPFVTHDAEGDCVAVWTRWEDGALAGNRRDPGSGSWLLDAQLLEAPSGYKEAVTGAILPGDTVLAVWMQSLGAAGIQIWANRFDPTHPNWINARSIDGISAYAGVPSIALTATQAWVVWGDWYDGSVHANRLDLEAGTWLDEAFVLAPGTTASHHPNARIASTSDGHLIVIWVQGREGQSDVVGRHYDPLSLSWSSDVVIASDTGWSTDVHEMSPPKLAVDAQGNALVVWIHDTGNDVELRARHYDSVSQGWLPPVTLMSGGESMEADLAMDASGRALVVWVQVDDNGVDRSVWAVRSAP